MEVEFNFKNKLMARELLQCAEENNLLPDEQCGNRHVNYAAK